MPLADNNTALRLRTRKASEINIDTFRGGVNSLFSETRLDKDEAKEALNMMLIEDGIWSKRWGTGAYGGVTFTNRPDGAQEYRKSDGTRELVVVADGNAYVVDPDAGTKTLISGSTGAFTQGTRCYFIQFDQYLYIANGLDDLGRYDGSTLSTYSGLSVPSWDGTPIVRGAGLSSGAYTYYYQVTAVNEVGETTPVAETSITVDIPRDEWDEADEILTLGWGDVSGADKYVIYFSDTSGFEVKLAEVTASTYVDDGTDIPNDYIEPPTDNTTTGPVFGPMAISGNRLWGTQDPTREYRVYHTGTGVNRGNFSPAYGGGWLDLQKGGRETCVTIVDYQGKPHLFMQTDDGHGSIWQITMDTIEIAGTSFVVPIPTKIIASIGTNAPRSVVYVENDIFFFNKRGMYVLGNEPGILDVLRTNELTAKIRPYVQSLSGANIDKTAAYYYDAKVLVSVSQAAGEPDRTFLFDRERGALIKDWSVGVSQFLEYTDSEGETHLLGIASDRLIEFSENYEGDQGTAFTWRYISGRYPINKDWTQFARTEFAAIRLRNANGSIDFTIRGTGKQSLISNVGTGTITPESSSTGIGFDLMGSIQIGTTSGTPTAFASENLLRMIKIPFTKRTMRDIQFEVSGDSLADRAAITGLWAGNREHLTSRPLDWNL